MVEVNNGDVVLKGVGQGVRFVHGHVRNVQM